MDLVLWLVAVALISLMGMFNIVSVVLWFVVVGKMFARDGILTGLLGLFIGPYAFIWGWQQADRMELRGIMSFWTAALVVCLTANIFAILLC
jgi:hypothetical protein